MPTVTGLVDRKDVLVLAMLQVKGAIQDLKSLKGGSFPDNTQFMDYFPHDALLRHEDVFDSASGLGGLTHAVANAVPVIQAGDRLDKPNNAMRVEHADLEMFAPYEGHPSIPQRIAAAVSKLLYASSTQSNNRCEC